MFFICLVRAHHSPYLHGTYLCIFCDKILSVVGSAIAIEILAMLCLGGVLLYFLVKCMTALKGKPRDRVNNEVHTPEQTPSHQVSILLLETFTRQVRSGNFHQASAINILSFLIWKLWDTIFFFADVLIQHKKMSPSPSDDAGYCSAPAAVLSLGRNQSSFRQR